MRMHYSSNSYAHSVPALTASSKKQVFYEKTIILPEPQLS